MTEERHSRRDLSFVCSRRTFFRALLQEAFVVRRSLNGQQSGRLSSLGSLPDDQLAKVRPVVSKDCEIVEEQGVVWAKNRLKGKPRVKLFSVEDEENLMALRLFDGRYSLGDVGSMLAREANWDGSRAFAHVRDLFLTLVERGVCHPKDPPEPEA